MPALLLFWYACRVRHPARPRWRAFLMALAVLAALPATYAAGIHYVITVRDESPFILLPVALSLPFVLRADGGCLPFPDGSSSNFPSTH